MAEEVAPRGRPRTQPPEKLDVEPDQAPAATSASSEHAGEYLGTPPLPVGLTMHGARTDPSCFDRICIRLASPQVPVAT